MLSDKGVQVVNACAGRSDAERMMHEHHGEHPFSHAGQLIALVVFLAVWAADSFLLRETTFLSDVIPLALRLVVLGLALGIAVSLIRSGHVVISRHEPPKAVVTTGAFRYVRHPIYLGTVLAYAGLSLATASVLSLATTALAVVFYSCIASYEERLLEARFGDEYRRYKMRTGKWVPRLA